jgi:CubicO group peptidase (beta-lactamase class C family)/D-alanyl-D-alanine dipeptidase
MIRRARLACLGLLAAVGAQAAPPPLDARIGADIDAVVAQYHLPGIAVGVIRDGKIVHVHTVGERQAGTGQAVTRDTLFKIASNSKAMTASLLARLVDAGKLRWDDPVVKHLPNFRMHDAWVTQNIQVRDLLVHNSGLPEGGGDLMLWPEPNNFSRGDILAGLAHIPPAYGFRSGYAYDNTLYIVAGELAAAVGGASYEELMRREVFEPLGLGCRVGEFRRDQAGPLAQPHRRIGAANVATEPDGERVPAISSAAAGGILCSLDDMLAWAGNWLQPTAAQLAWLSAAQRAEMTRPRTPMPVSDRNLRWNKTHARFYALGFRIADMDGAWTVSHTGTLSGMYSAMFLIPDRRSGFVFLINSDAEDARTVLSEVLLKHFTAPGRVPGVASLAAELQRDASAPSASRAPDISAQKPASVEQMRPWLGQWRDPWFGMVSICEHEGAVRLSSVKSPVLSGRVMALGEDRLVDWDDDDEPAWLRFSTGTKGPMLRMAKVDPDADFSYDYEDLAFERVGECDAVSPASTAVEAGLVDIATLVPDIALDMRYAGRDNFVGAPVDGYLAPKCLVTRPVAEALRRTELALRGQGLRLKLFDCYRPARAVDHFMRWVADPADQRTKPGFYPNLEKGALPGAYIAPVSGHSRGATVDLTLMRCAGQACAPLDMGTEFDFFDARANTASPAITAAQRANRELLRAAMINHGFSDYPMEWWHFTLHPESVPRIRYDVPIR